MDDALRQRKKVDSSKALDVLISDPYMMKSQWLEYKMTADDNGKSATDNSILSIPEFIMKRSCIRKNEHLKQTYKDLFDSIKRTRVQTKDQNDSLMAQLNKKSNENVDVLAQIQKKGFEQLQ
ncbi:hypothetical protein Tco_0758404 [Tanacetum coccineum]